VNKVNKNGAAVGGRQPLISAASSSGEWGMLTAALFSSLRSTSFRCHLSLSEGLKSLEGHRKWIPCPLKLTPDRGMKPQR
jgi:hypothetical protein